MSDLPLILIVEDEKPIRHFLKVSLAEKGYRLAEADTGRRAMALIQSDPPDLIILDLGLPDMDGLEIIDWIRQWSERPIIILSARDQEADKISALDRGADDYLTKPFGVGELLARLRVAMRHASRTESDIEQYECGRFAVDLIARVVRVDGQEAHLTPIEYRLLVALIRNAGKVLTHRFLLNEVWGPNHAQESHTLRVHMANLRRKIELNPARPDYILTEQGAGYRLREP